MALPEVGLDSIRPLISQSLATRMPPRKCREDRGSNARSIFFHRSAARTDFLAAPGDPIWQHRNGNSAGWDRRPGERIREEDLFWKCWTCSFLKLFVECWFQVSCCLYKNSSFWLFLDWLKLVVVVVVVFRWFYVGFKPSCHHRLFQAIEAASMSQFAGWGVMVSHRSGETEAPEVLHSWTGTSTMKLCPEK